MFELDDGDFALIGIRITEAAKQNLPASAGGGPDEEIVRIPRRILIQAKSDIPDSA